MTMKRFGWFTTTGMPPDFKLVHTDYAGDPKEVHDNGKPQYPAYYDDGIKSQAPFADALKTQTEQIIAKMQLCKSLGDRDGQEYWLFALQKVQVLSDVCGQMDELVFQLMQRP